MHAVRSTKRSLFFLAIGAAVAYLFDPQAGRSRREHLLGKLQPDSPSSRNTADTLVEGDGSGGARLPLDEKPDSAFHSTSATEFVIPNAAPQGVHDDAGVTPADDGAPAISPPAR